MKSGFRILQSNAKSENGFDLLQIRLQGGFQLRNLNSDFMDFPFTIRLENPKKDLQNYSREKRSSLLLIMLAHARPLFLRTVFQILFRISQSNSKNKYFGVEIRFRISRSIANRILKSKSRFPNRTHP